MNARTTLSRTIQSRSHMRHQQLSDGILKSSASAPTAPQSTNEEEAVNQKFAY